MREKGLKMNSYVNVQCIEKQFTDTFAATLTCSHIHRQVSHVWGKVCQSSWLTILSSFYQFHSDILVCDT